jgi:hypothetical protein
MMSNQHTPPLLACHQEWCAACGRVFTNHTIEECHRDTDGDCKTDLLMIQSGLTAGGRVWDWARGGCDALDAT